MGIQPEVEGCFIHPWLKGTVHDKDGCMFGPVLIIDRGAALVLLAKGRSFHQDRGAT